MDAPVEGVVALLVEQAETLQEIARIALSREMRRSSRRGITDPQFFDQDGIAQSSLLRDSVRASG